MERQLILLDDLDDLHELDDLRDSDDRGAIWRLDETTKERGRQGVALARAALVEASRRTAA